MFSYVGAENAAQRAIAKARLFGEASTVPVAAHILGMSKFDPSDERILAAFEKFDVPEDWCRDPIIIVEAFASGWEDAACATRLLATLVDRRHGKKAHRAAKMRPDDRLDKYTPAAGSKSAAEAVIEPSRAPKEVKAKMARELKNLYIDMKNQCPTP